MAATMSLKQHGADDAINRRITVLVLNKQTQEGIEHENAESNAMDIAQPDSLKQLAPSATAPASQTPEPSAAAPEPAASTPAPSVPAQVSPAIAPADQASEQPAAAPAPTNRDSQPEVTP
jgi:Predicted membrane protein